MRVPIISIFLILVTAFPALAQKGDFCSEITAAYEAFYDTQTYEYCMPSTREQADRTIEFLYFIYKNSDEQIPRYYMKAIQRLVHKGGDTYFYHYYNRFQELPAWRIIMLAERMPYEEDEEFPSSVPQGERDYMMDYDIKSDDLSAWVDIVQTMDATFPYYNLEKLIDRTFLPHQDEMDFEFFRNHQPTREYAEKWRKQFPSVNDAYLLWWLEQSGIDWFSPVAQWMVDMLFDQARSTYHIDRDLETINWLAMRGLGSYELLQRRRGEDSTYLTKIAFLLLFRNIRQSHILKEVTKIVVDDILDRSTEHGGWLYLTEKGELIVEVISPRETGENRAYYTPWKSALNRLAQFHLHAVGLDNRIYAGPSAPDLQMVRFNFLPSVVITSILDNGKMFLDFDYYRQQIESDRMLRTLGMSFINPLLEYWHSRVIVPLGALEVNLIEYFPFTR